MLMFYIGSTVDKKLIHSGKFRFIPVESLDKVESWFRKYGYFIVVVNRFMPGTRAIISFFAGISNLDPKKTIALCFVICTSLECYIIFILDLYLVITFAIVDEYLTTYSNIVIAVTVFVILFFIVRLFFKKRKSAA